MKVIPCEWTDVFPGGVPSWVIFGMQVKDIQKRLVAESHRDNTTGNDLAELSLIGLVAYFEGFARYHFASCANICPKLLANFATARPETSLPLRDVVDMDTLHGQVGFLLADSLHFSTAKEINSQFRDLLGITPFGKTESTKHDRILHDRNQIVHNAGMYTIKYLRTHRQEIPPERARPYEGSVVITPKRADEAATFLLAIARKITESSHAILNDPSNWEPMAEQLAMKKHIAYIKWMDGAFDYETELDGHS